MFWNMLIGPIAETVNTVLKRVLPPEKMSEGERAQMEAALTAELLKADWSRFEAEVQDRIDARGLAKAELDKGNAFTTILAATHRPIWSFCILGLFAWTLLAKPLGFPDVPLSDVHKDIMQTVIIFYFGGRSVEKVMDKIGGARKAVLTGGDK